MKMSENGLAIGIDIGGTKMAIGIATSTGEILDTKVVNDHVTMPEKEMISYCYKLAEELTKKNGFELQKCKGVGVCIAGHVNSHKGILVTTSNLKGFKNYPLKEELEKVFHLPVIIDNDANCQAYGEHKYGAGKGYDDMVFITISSGIGAGLILNGKLYRGIYGTAGEVGHMIIEHGSTKQCTCGNYGCLMACGSSISLNGLAGKYLNKGFKSDFINHEMLNKGKICGKIIKKGADAGDNLCNAIVTELADYISIGIYNVFQLLNPQIVLLGGGLMKLGELFFEDIKEKFKKLAGNMLTEEMPIRRIKLDDNAGMLGVSIMVFENNK